MELDKCNDNEDSVVKPKQKADHPPKLDAPRTILPSSGSSLLDIPFELRKMIWDFYFFNTRLTFGIRAQFPTVSSTKIMKPAPHSLALLRACRQIHEEMKGSHWLEKVLFCFERVEELLDKLSPLPTTTLSKIRHIRTGGTPLNVEPLIWVTKLDSFHHLFTKEYSLAWALKFLPALQLDTLTVLFGRSDGRTYEAVESLIMHGDGWRELRCIINCNELSFPTYHTWKMMTLALIGREPTHPQPAFWTAKLLERDGVVTRAPVEIYCFIHPNLPDILSSAETCQIVDEMIILPPGVDVFAKADSTEARKKAMMIVVKRAPDVDITQNTSAQLPTDDPRYSGKAWERIRMNTSCVLFDEEGLHVEADHYSSVDEYVWAEMKYKLDNRWSLR